MQLRHYQRSAIDSLYAYWQDKPTGSPLIVLPTGAGKSLVIAKLMQEFHEVEPSTRIIQVTHVKELIEQNFRELMGIWPRANAGIFSASLGRRDARRPIVFCGIQTVHNKAREIGHADVLLIDEAHLVPPDAKTMYGRFIADMRAVNPSLIVVGLTATPYRLDSGSLIDGDDRLFDDVAFDYSIRDLIDEGFLVPLISKATATRLDVSGVKKRGGDYIAGDLQRAVDKRPITTGAVDEMVAFGADRKAWLCFCAGVEHAHHVADELRSRGYPAAAVDGSMNRTERDKIIGDFRAGRLRALTNANVLTTGFNVPHVDLLAMLRPTASVSLYVQMAGRGTRCVGPNIEASRAAGKSDCLVLDFAGNVRRHGPVDAVKVKKPGSGDGEAPIKECPQCHSLIFAGLRVCPDCGHEFEREPDKNLTASAAAAPILSRSAPHFSRVTSRVFYRHEKPGSRPSIRVEYLCGLGISYREWICPEHDGYAREKFVKYWREHSGRGPTPATIEETLRRISELREVEEIRVRASGKYWEVCGYKLAAPGVVKVAALA